MRAAIPLTGPALAAALIAGSPAAAQTWTAQPASDAWDAAAVAEWSSGATLVARCREGRFRLMIELVAPLEGTAAMMRYAFDEDEALTRLSALAPDGEAVFVRHPADFARSLLSARSLDVTVADGETPQQRYVLEAPASPEVLGEVLTACGEPLDPAEALRATIIPDPDWAQRPSGRDLATLYPARAARRGTNGVAEIECIVTVEGRLEECLTAWERPEGEGFGDATIAAAMRGFRLRQPEPGSALVAGSVVSITLRWYIH